MRRPLPVQTAQTTAYVVAAPCRADIMTGALRSAYAGQGEEPAAFADLITLLDRIESIPQRI
uniref:hypothetical protein n=1 Tax=uncultured Sphingomonas sp. TaxID=158754 RepID=UPI0035C9592A